MRTVTGLMLLMVSACSSAPMGAPDAQPDAHTNVSDVGVSSDASRDPGLDVGPEPGDAGVDARRDAGGSDVSEPLPDAGPRLGAPYPIILAHGFFGFEDFAGIDFIGYFFGVREHLEGAGEALVFTPAVDPFNNSTRRGQQLEAAIEAILAETGHAQVNIIGHSQGGLDARYVASVRPDLVASVTTVASPHDGTPLIDFVVRAAEDSRLRGLLDDLVRILGAPLWDEAGEETSLFEALRQLGTSGARDFSRMYPDSEGVAYHSIGGRSGSSFALRACRPDGDGVAFLRRWNSTLDPIDPLLAFSESLYDGTIFDPEPNDGLVRVSSSRHGRFLGCIPADHLDQVGHLLGDEPGLFNRWDHREFYEELVEWLRSEGH